MEARPEESQDLPQPPELALVTTASSQTDDKIYPPESRLFGKMAELPDGVLPDFINPNNPKMPSEKGEIALECLRDLGTAGITELRISQIVQALDPIIKSKNGKKVLKSLIGVEDPELKNVAASGFNILKARIAVEPVKDEARPTKKERRQYDPTQESLKVLGNPEAKKPEKERSLKKLLRPRMMVSPEEFFGSGETIYETIKSAMKTGDPNVTQAHYELRVAMMNGHEGYSLESVEKLIKEWEASGDKEVELYEHPLIKKLQLSFLAQMKLLTIPDHRDAAKFAKDYVREAMLLLKDTNEPGLPLSVVKEKVDKAAGRALAFAALPEGLKKDVYDKFEKRLVIVRTPAMVVSKERKPASSLERITHLLTEAYDRIETYETHAS